MLFNVVHTSIQRYARCIDIKTTLCALCGSSVMLDTYPGSSADGTKLTVQVSRFWELLHHHVTDVIE